MSDLYDIFDQVVDEVRGKVPDADIKSAIRDYNCGEPGYGISWLLSACMEDGISISREIRDLILDNLIDDDFSSVEDRAEEVSVY